MHPCANRAWRAHRAGAQAAWLVRSSSSCAALLHRDQAPEDLAPRDPAVDGAAVVADLEALALDRLDQVKVLVAFHAAEHDVIDRERVCFGERLHGAELPARNLADHAV